MIHYVMYNHYNNIYNHKTNKPQMRVYSILQKAHTVLYICAAKCVSVCTSHSERVVV